MSRPACENCSAFSQGLAGTCLIVGVQALGGLGEQLVAQIAVVVATICYAGAAIFSRGFKDLDPMAPAAGSLLCGAAILVPLSLVVDRPWTLAPSASSMLALLGLAVFSTALAFVIYFRLIQTLGSVGTTSQAYLRVPIGVAIGVLFLGESLTPTAWIGLGCVVIGVAAMTIPARASRRAALLTGLFPGILLQNSTAETRNNRAGRIVKINWRSIAAAATWLACLAAPGAGQAQDTFPNRPVRIVVPYSPGSVVDVFARIVAQNMAAQWNGSIVVESKSGANGSIAAEEVARAAPDGYTWLLVTTFFTASPALDPKLRWDPVRDFIPVGQICRAPNFFIVPVSLPVRSVAEYVALAKAKSGRAEL